MFTGIIQELGKVTKIDQKQNMVSFTIEAKKTSQELQLGASVAINGACMTTTKIDKKTQTFQFDTIEESLQKTNLSELKVNDLVNLETALKANQGLDGHIVQGHIDTTAKVIALKSDKNKVTLTIEIPESIIQYLALKGSITINGVSLTISNLTQKSFSVELIPHTLEHTNLKNLAKDHKVNLEIDIIARYIESMLNKKELETKYQYLFERNLI